MKKDIFRPKLIESWGEILSELKVATKQVAIEGSKVIYKYILVICTERISGYPAGALL